MVKFAGCLPFGVQVGLALGFAAAACCCFEPPVDSSCEKALHTEEVPSLQAALSICDFHEEYAEMKPVSAWSESDEKGSTVEVAHDVSHTFSVKKGSELELGEIIKIIKITLSKSFATSKGEKSSLKHKLTLNPFSKGRLMFQERRVHIKARLRKGSASCLRSIIKNPTKLCSDIVDEELELLSTETDSQGHATGSYSIEYVGTNKFRHPDFHNLLDRTAALTRPYEFVSTSSPHYCAKRAERYNRTIALYELSTMTCYVEGEKSSDSNRLLNSRGGFIGKYTISGNNKQVSLDSSLKANWIATGNCDLIGQTVVSSGDGRGGDEAVEFQCKSFEKRAGHVLMFKISSLDAPAEPQLRRQTLQRQPAGASPNAAQQVASEQQLDFAANQNLTSGCLDCICEATSGCNENAFNKCAGDSVCGPFAISEAYWQDGQRPGASFVDCARTKTCSREAVKNYMSRYARDCNGDNLVTCSDYAAIHKRGPGNCESRDLLREAYWNTFSACQKARDA